MGPIRTIIERVRYLNSRYDYGQTYRLLGSAGTEDSSELPEFEITVLPARLTHGLELEFISEFRCNVLLRCDVSGNMLGAGEGICDGIKYLNVIGQPLRLRNIGGLYWLADSPLARNFETYSEVVPEKAEVPRPVHEPLAKIPMIVRSPPAEEQEKGSSRKTAVQSSSTPPNRSDKKKKKSTQKKLVTNTRD